MINEILQMKCLFAFLCVLWTVSAEEYTTAIDHTQLLFHDAFNNSFLTRQEFRGQYTNDSAFPGTYNLNTNQ